MRTLLVFIYLCYSSTKYGVTTSCPNFYWRDFMGTIHMDAFVGAKNAVQDVYVGLVFVRSNSLVPATIEPITGIAYVSHNGKLHKTNDHVKILASPDNEQFEWIPIHSSDLSLHSSRAVPGGNEAGQPVYIGRALYDGEYRIGQVRSDQDRGLLVVKEGRSTVTTLSYDLLVYNCSRTADDTADVKPAVCVLDEGVDCS